MEKVEMQEAIQDILNSSLVICLRVAQLKTIPQSLANYCKEFRSVQSMHSADKYAVNRKQLVHLLLLASHKLIEYVAVGK